MNYNYIAIEGTIGAGKTTLAQKLSTDFNSTSILEEFAENTFLEKFYGNPDDYAFPLEVSFLVSRFNQLQNNLSKGSVFQQKFISDYLFDKSLVFAQNNLKSDQYKLFYQLYSVFIKQLPRPELLIYLHNSISNLQENIKRRGRPFELKIEDEYLTNIQELYLAYFKTLETIPVICLDVSKADFVNDNNKYQLIKNLSETKFEAGLHFIDI